MAIDPKECRLVSVFASNVRAHRERLGLSQEALAERAGVHRTYVGMIERCEKNATLHSVERIADALRLPAANLLAENVRIT